MRPTNEHVRSDIQEEKFRIRSLSGQGGEGMVGTVGIKLAGKERARIGRM